MDEVLGEQRPEVAADGPGGASAGLVGPIKVRTMRQVSSGPSTTRTIDGERVMNRTRSS